jgi:hypothetical protein
LADVQNQDVADVLTFFAAMVGTDFNEGGLQAHGPKKSQEVTVWLWKAWQQQQGSSSKRSLDFDAFVEGVITRDIHVESPKKTFQTFLQVLFPTYY